MGKRKPIPEPVKKDYTNHVFKQDDKVLLVIREVNGEGELMKEDRKTAVVNGISRFDGLVIVDDVAFRPSGDGRWIGIHKKGGNRRISHFIEPVE